MTHIHQGYALTTCEVRRVWALLTHDPAISLRELARRSGGSFSRTRAIVGLLIGAGYVEHKPAAHRARRVVVPLHEEARRDHR